MPRGTATSPSSSTCGSEVGAPPASASGGVQVHDLDACDVEPGQQNAPPPVAGESSETSLNGGERTFRLATFFLSKEPGEKLLKAIGFREDERGANVWLVVPNDDAVFMGAKEVDGIRCVHPLQAYLDLTAHPERAAEAAAELRKRLLTWKT
jgi:hypothetical protein